MGKIRKPKRKEGRVEERKIDNGSVVQEILNRFIIAYPGAKVGLDFASPFELLVATILSAQCTDDRVNIVTKKLFLKYKNPQDYIDVSQEELEEDIRSTGFFRNKARNIRGCCAELIERFNGEVPSSVEELTSLPGVGRKTANCVLSTCFNIAAITVDTHVMRVSNRLGLVQTEDAEKVEYALMDLVEKVSWNDLNHLFITHGRRTCIARKPKCAECVVNDLCPSSLV
ncbi:MAG: endonuclease III [Ignavibacteria bacterium]|nr:endonuclease III [Ignavibacteria bacterium]